ncbi:MAG: S-adenosylmethionine decarboxylase [Myxococcota bacterium]|nr:S-adenosylmethionine decarboxylase [Myxococcota bacterium]
MVLLGVHWIFDAHGGSPERLSQVEILRETLVELPRALGLTPVSAPQTHRYRKGESDLLGGLVLLSESHLSLHLCPEEGALAGDLFSCKPFDLDVARSFLQDRFAFEGIRDSTLERCIPG